MGKQFSNPTIETMNAAVGQVQDAVADVQAIVTDLKDTDVAQIGTKINALAENGQTPVSTYESSDNYINTVVDISGSGVLLRMQNSATTSSLSVSIDGGPKILCNGGYIGLRFKNRLLVKGAGAPSNDIAVIYRLD